MTQKSTYIQPARVVSGIEQTVVHVPHLTVKKLADKLVSIEKEKGYEFALLGVESMDYVKICHLCLEKHLDNDPNLMPSRFMILWGASDDGLGGKKNLDLFPYPMVNDGRPKMSVAKLGWNLAAIGWNPHFHDGLEELVDDDDAEDGVELEDPTVLKGTLFGALCSYIEAAAPAVRGNLAGGTHVVQAGECLSDIAEIHGIREWRFLWQINKDALGENWDVLKVGTELKLPDATSNPLADWFCDNGWDDYLNPDMGYQYPAKYLSLTFLDEDDKPLVFQDDNGNKVSRKCQVYATAPNPLLIHEFDLDAGDDLDVVVPDTQNIGLWIENEDIPFNGTVWPNFGSFLHNGVPAGSGSDPILDPIDLPWTEIDIDDPVTADPGDDEDPSSVGGAEARLEDEGDAPGSPDPAPLQEPQLPGTPPLS